MNTLSAAPKFKLSAFVATLLLALTASAPLRAQGSNNHPGESSPPAKATSSPDKPIHHQWTLSRLNGVVTLDVEPSGHWSFDCDVKDHLKDELFDVAFILRSLNGKIFEFTNKSDASFGVVFHRDGNSTNIAENFKQLKEHHWSAVYTLHKDVGQILNISRADQRKLDQIHAEELEARKHHNEQEVAKKKREAQEEARAELKREKEQNNSALIQALEQAIEAGARDAQRKQAIDQQAVATGEQQADLTLF